MNSIHSFLEKHTHLVIPLRWHRRRVRISAYFACILSFRTVHDFINLVHKRFSSDSSPLFRRMMSLLNGYTEGTVAIETLTQEFSVLFQTQPELYQDFLSLFHVDRIPTTPIYSQRAAIPVNQLESQPMPQFTYTQVPSFLSMLPQPQPSLFAPPTTPQLPYLQYTQIPAVSPPTIPLIPPAKVPKSIPQDDGPLDSLRQCDASRFSKFVKLCYLFTKVCLHNSTHY